MRAHVAVSRIIALVSIVLLLPLTALAQSATPSTSKNVDWPMYGNDIGAMHYQNLDQINPSNVSQLQPAWILHTGVAMNIGASFENQPIVTDGMMFVSTGHDQVLALDPATGAIKWTYDPTDMPPINDLPICCGQDNRGVAVGDGKVFMARLDATLVALDEQTGKVLWNTPVADWQSGYAETMAPLYIDNEVIVGSSGAEMEVRGFVAAYDAKTGQQLWRFLTVPGPGHVGHDTWAGNSWLTGGATVWDSPTADPKLGLVYFSTANASPDYDGSRRAGDNLFAASIVALNYKTGKLAWYYQEVHHDIWDYDGPEPTLLFDFVKDGKTTPAIGHSNKAGFYFILDRRTGKPLIPIDEVAVSTSPSWQHASPTQPQPTTGYELVPHTVNPKDVPAGMTAASMWTPPREDFVVINPGPSGGPQWPPAAYSPRTKYVYVPAGGYMPFAYEANPNYPENTTGSGGTNVGVKADVQYGLLDAVDTTTGKIAWQVKTDWRTISGVGVAGDLVFFGRSNGEFDAFDAKTGKLLWSWNNPTDEPHVGGANGSPAIYMVDGREYVVLAFGGNETAR
ncbi:MAG TPA: PQQ-binding-like beta-propeller repeat protein, partial [Thermomicrobiales bacterium]|nr:PQQ-binding-like beta-propeller repeat protein [Thermomicrobiales bacterium]